MKKIITAVLFIIGFNLALLGYLSAKTMEYKYLGKNNAPVVIYNFSSLICPHCADFEKDILPRLVKDYVTQGKLKIVFMDVPFGSPNNLLAHTLLHYTNSNQEFFQLTKAFFANQATWVQASNPTAELKKYTTLLGMSDATFKKATEDKKLQQWLMSNTKKHLKDLGIQGTPTVFFVKKDEKLTSSSKHISGVPDYNAFKKIIDGLLK